MADKVIVDLRHKFDQGLASSPYGIDNDSFVVSPEGGHDNLADSCSVGFARRANVHQTPIFSASAWLMGWWARSWSSSASSLTASNAAMQPIPAAVTA